ncbi:hypothetical protein [Marivirga atlantica]|jgi:hypothetical protein|uniref:VWA domain-containing protein n=1 Tax=Marivirga atlantica TaxID=1548457 RepID=A0A937AKS5_9BACT|nr:hypothetical protein [Marivirga atlantica]MBL0764517.1 hypothetical protein [Marivirga atlantica]
MLNTSLSSYWLLLCIILGLGYAYLLYTAQKQPWSSKWKWLLFSIRGIAVAAITFLFLEPFVNQTSTEVESRKLVFLWDDSESAKLALGNEVVEKEWKELHELADEVAEQKKVELQWKNLANKPIENPDSVPTEAALTPLRQSLDAIASGDQSNSIAEVVLISDGIYNRGASPDYYAYPFKVSTIGLGDSTEKKDVSIASLKYNKVVYQGNKFPMLVEIAHQGFENESIQVVLKNNGEILNQKTIKINSQDITNQVSFLVEANSEGYQQYEIQLNSTSEEFNKANNSRTAFVNIVEGKKKIVLLAAAPHPDIKAIKKSIERNENYELILAIDQVSAYKADDYDLAILFHLPNRKNVFQNEIKQLYNANTSIWFVVGNGGIDIAEFNMLNEGVQLNPWQEVDEANIYYNNDFNAFDLDRESIPNLDELPPASMPFIEHRINPKAETLFYKRVGRVKTQQPISVFYEDGDYKESTLLLEGFWNWRLVEYLQTEEYKLFDDWVGKTVRWLTTKNNKSQLEVYSIKESYASFEQVSLAVETYNEVYQEIFGKKINLNISGSDSTYQFSFTTDRLTPNFEIGTLPEGKYVFEASATINGKSFVDKGQFVVSGNNFEELNLLANFGMLERLADKNEGRFFHYQNTSELLDYLVQNDYPQILKSKNKTVPLTNNYWLYVIILILIFMEWFLRRYFGSY